MNRKILFRGQRADGKWLYGDLIHNRRRTYIADDSVVNGDDIQGHTDFEVNPNTIGQYTGREDVNNKPIFTGQTVLFWIQGKHFKGVVEYSETIAGYCVNILIDGKRSNMFSAFPKQCAIDPKK